MHQRTVFFISDGTGLTAQALGQLLAHFPDTAFRQIRLPFTNTLRQVLEAMARIDMARAEDNVQPIVVMSLGNVEHRTMIKQCSAYYIDLFESFINPLGVELGETPLTGSGIAHSIQGQNYSERMEAINFTLGHDDGMTEEGLEEAQVILIGVSRCGKTPTSLYMAMQFGIKAANYPLIPEDLERGHIPAVLENFPHKLFGMTIKPERLHSVRSERRPNSFYASLDNCRNEVRMAEEMMRNSGVRWVDSTSRSIEELSTTILQELQLSN
jgi:regulator of PEP synthase PpsR (kinase-PPPase family)